MPMALLTARLTALPPNTESGMPHRSGRTWARSSLPRGEPGQTRPRPARPSLPAWLRRISPRGGLAISVEPGSRGRSGASRSDGGQCGPRDRAPRHRQPRGVSTWVESALVLLSARFLHVSRIHLTRKRSRGCCRAASGPHPRLPLCHTGRGTPIASHHRQMTGCG